MVHPKADLWIWVEIDPDPTFEKVTESSFDQNHNRYYFISIFIEQIVERSIDVYLLYNL